MGLWGELFREEFAGRLNRGLRRGSGWSFLLNFYCLISILIPLFLIFTMDVLVMWQDVWDGTAIDCIRQALYFYLPEERLFA